MLKWLMNKFRKPGITVSQFKEWEMETRYTPDIALLERKKFVPLLEYSDAQRQGPWYCLIDRFSYFQAHAFTVAHNHVLYTHNNGGLHAIALTAPKKKFARDVGQYLGGRIRGELHMVEADGILALDNIRQNGVRYRRIQVPIVIPYREEQKITDLRTGHYRKLLTGLQHRKIKVAHMYVGVPDFWMPQIDDGYAFPRASYVTPVGKRPVPFYHFENAPKRTLK